MDGLPEAAVCDVWQIVETQTQDPREAGGNRSDLMKKTNTKAETQKLNNVQTKKRNRQIKRWRSNLEIHEEQNPENKPWETRRHRLLTQGWLTNRTQVNTGRIIKQNDIKPGNWTNSTSHSWSVQTSDPHEDRVHCQLSASRRVIQTTQVVCWIWLLNRIITSSYSISCASRHTTVYIWNGRRDRKD